VRVRERDEVACVVRDLVGERRVRARKREGCQNANVTALRRLVYPVSSVKFCLFSR